MTDWRLKIFAYLHDPPDKPLALGRQGGHEAWGRELACRLAEKPLDAEWPRWERLIKQADHLASGADRSGLLQRRTPSLDELRHPLSGQPIDLSWARPDPEAAVRALEEEFAALEPLKDDPQAAFLALWGLLPIRLRSRRGPEELGGLWDLLPAETRMPNHPIIVHQALVSALATVLDAGDEALLLSFSVGSVQRFIAQARRLSDLWAGSALLSRALLQATLPIVESLGPDHVVFPILRRSRLFLEEWLVADKSVAARCRHADRLRKLTPRAPSRSGTPSGGLPNRFLAIVPAAQARDLASACEQRLRRWWEDTVFREGSWLEQSGSGPAGFAVMAREQARGSLRVTWATTPWPMAESVREENEGARAAWLLGGKLPTHITDHLEAARAVKDAAKAAPRPAAGEPGARPATAFTPNGGILYGACYDSVERLIGAVKLTRCEFPRSEDGLKCSLCGERAVAPPATFEEQKVLWGGTRSGLQSRGMVRRGEALCGVCWAKRRYGLQQDVPSTSEIAATPFKRRVLCEIEELAPEVRTLCDAVQDWPGHPKAFVVPELIHDLKHGGLAEHFARIAGEVLLGNPREDREEDQEEDIVPERVMRAVRDLRRAARLRCDIDPPRPYLAVLVMDGDEMGKWLSGERNRPLRDYLSSEAAADLEERGMEPFLRDGGPIWPMTPALHAALSEACAVFSQRTAARTIERDGLPAFLVYAGGDDVLALTPIGCHDPRKTIELATEAAQRLRLRFSGHVRRDRDRGDVPDAASEAGYVLDPHDGLGMAFGKRATASAGLAVFHHKWPLGRALEEARRAEKLAKNELGRDALAISILRRSGQVTHTGLKFGLEPQRGAVAALQHLCHAFAFGRLSPRFVSEIRRRLADFHGGLEEGALVNLARPLVHEAATGHFGRTNRRGGEPPTGNDETELADILLTLNVLSAASKRAADGSATNSKGEAGRNPQDLKQLNGWCDLIEAAAFLGRGEEP